VGLRVGGICGAVEGALVFAVGRSVGDHEPPCLVGDSVGALVGVVGDAVGVPVAREGLFVGDCVGGARVGALVGEVVI
jgi:hypothetical protein